MDFLFERVKKINSVPEPSFSKSVVYIMSRDQRLDYNYGLWAAFLKAKKLNLELVVCFNIYPSVKFRLYQHYMWMFDGLKEIEQKLSDLGYKFQVYFGALEKSLIKIQNEFNPVGIFTDFNPRKSYRNILEKIAKDLSTPIFWVDSRNSVPVWIASIKEEIGARTLRKNIEKHIPLYSSHKSFKLEKKTSIVNKTPWDNFSKKLKVQRLENYTLSIKAGEDQAQMTALNFIKNKLLNYSLEKNSPEIEEATSGLSAYLHFGMISPIFIINKVKEIYPKEFTLNLKKSENDSLLVKSIKNFFDEILVRRDLSDNFLFYNSNYDNPNGAKLWAISSLDKHRVDSREYTYTYEEFFNANTHDEAWNACQRQLRSTGKMHGYMRMYWAKKILEWSSSAEEALKISIELNDTLQLDGSDSNGYAGCMWSIYGIHDIGFTERNIFGKIRYMNFAGLKRKFEIKKYIKRWE